MSDKSKHYTSAEAYTDLDGLSKQFTFIDHDKKSRMSTFIEADGNTERFKDILNKGIDEILALPASAVVTGWNADKYEQFVIRDRENGITWRKDMVREALNINPDMYYSMYVRVWKNTVKEKYWFDEMSHEDILAGKWKEWI